MSYMVNAAVKDFLEGVHHRTDDYKIALFQAAGSTNLTKAGTTSYTGTSGEVSGANYTAGGELLTKVTSTVDGVSLARSYTTTWDATIGRMWQRMDFLGVAVYADVNISGTIAQALLYNNTATGKNAIAVFDVGPIAGIIGTFELSMPTDVANPLIKWQLP